MSILFTNESVLDGISSFLFRRDQSEARNSKNSRLHAVLNDHVKMVPVTGIEVNKSAETLGISASTVTTTWEFEVLRAYITRN